MSEPTQVGAGAKHTTEGTSPTSGRGKPSRLRRVASLAPSGALFTGGARRAAKSARSKPSNGPLGGNGLTKTKVSTVATGGGAPTSSPDGVNIVVEERDPVVGPPVPARSRTRQRGSDIAEGVSKQKKTVPLPKGTRPKGRPARPSLNEWQIQALNAGVLTEEEKGRVLSGEMKQTEAETILAKRVKTDEKAKASPLPGSKEGQAKQRGANAKGSESSPPPLPSLEPWQVEVRRAGVLTKTEETKLLNGDMTQAEAKEILAARQKPKAPSGSKKGQAKQRREKKSGPGLSARDLEAKTKQPGGRETSEASDSAGKGSTEGLFAGLNVKTSGETETKAKGGSKKPAADKTQVKGKGSPSPEADKIRQRPPSVNKVLQEKNEGVKKRVAERIKDWETKKPQVEPEKVDKGVERKPIPPKGTSKPEGSGGKESSESAKGSAATSEGQDSTEEEHVSMSSHESSSSERRSSSSRASEDKETSQRNSSSSRSERSWASCGQPSISSETTKESTASDSSSAPARKSWFTPGRVLGGILIGLGAIGIGIAAQFSKVTNKLPFLKFLRIR